MPKAVVVKDRKVRYAAVGIGWIAQGYFLPCIPDTGNSELVALVSGHPEKAREAAQQGGIPDVYTYEEFPALLASGNIDAVYLATPNFEHTQLAIATLDAGVHLLLEKPMTVSVAECEQMIAASERTGAKLMVAYRLHYETGFLSALEIARSGKLGPLTYFNSSFSQVVASTNHRARNGFRAGPVPDLGPYTINAARNFFGEEPIEVFATGVRTSPRFNFDDTVAITLKFPGDKVAAMVVSYNGQDLDDFRVAGPLGDLFSQPAYGVNSQMKQILTIGEKKEHITCEKTDHFVGQTHYFSDCILKNKHPSSDGEEGLLDVRVIEAVERALQTGQPQTLQPYTRKHRPTMSDVQKFNRSKHPELHDVHKPSEG